MSERTSSSAAGAEAGFTLVEMLIAVALFALIGAAGLALLDGVLRARERADGRLERLGELQRAMYLVTYDFEQADPSMLSVEGGEVVIRRRSETLRYAVTDGSLERVAIGPFGGVAAQRLVSDVTDVSWAFHVPGAGWREDWSTPEQGGTADAPSPDAVALSLTLGEALAGPRGELRRVIALADGPPPERRGNAFVGLGR